MKVSSVALAGLSLALVDARPYNHFTFGQGSDPSTHYNPLNYVRAALAAYLGIKPSAEGFIAKETATNAPEAQTGVASVVGALASPAPAGQAGAAGSVGTTASQGTAAPQGVAAPQGGSSVAVPPPQSGPALPVGATTAAGISTGTASGAYWLEAIQRQGTIGFGNNTAYKVFRNVKDYGAVGDGAADDTEAINRAISDGNRCGQGCDSSTVTPALVYFPAGTYMVSKPIIQYYYTQMVGDALKPPTLKAASNFQGMAVVDADPYAYDNGVAKNWYTNQNNFFRQIRNFIIDLTGIADGSGAGIHWQVSQGTSLQNIRFEMKKGDSKQSGKVDCDILPNLR